MNNVSGYQFTLFRVIFGCYLTIHFFDLIFVAPELYSNVGTMADATLNATYPIFPNAINLFNGPLGTQVFLILLTVLSIVFITGFKRRWTAFLLWYGFACLFNRNILTSNPSLAYVGWALLACAIIPAGEPLSLEKPKEDAPTWEFPKVIWHGAWIILAVGYTYSGLHKCTSPSWINGDALYMLTTNPLARDVWYREFMLQFPMFMKISTWAVLALEVLYFPLALFKKTRPLAWTSMFLMHLGILTVVDFADLTSGMLMFHLFTFDPDWIKGKEAKEAKKKPVVFFDGVCGLCNSFIDFLFGVDKKGYFNVSTLQGEYAKEKLPTKLTENLDSVVLYNEGKTYTESDAVLFIYDKLGGIWKVFSFLKFIPKPIRDAGYKFIANNRYRFFGKKETCRFPTPEERARFIN